MDVFLNDSVGGDIKLLPGLLRGVQGERERLQDQLSGSGHGSRREEGGVVGDVRATVSALETARRHCGSLADSLGAYHCGEGGEGGGECVRRVRPLVDELVELEQLQSYLGWLRCLHDFSGSMEGLLLSAGTSSSSSGGVGGGGGGGGVEVVECYSRLVGVCHALRDSNCHHLRQFAGTARQHWQERLRERLASDFSSVLKELKWPFTSSAVSSKALDVWQKQEKRFTELFHLLAKLDRLDRPVKREEEEEEGGPLALDDHMLLPLGQLLDPLRKRFKYHFCGDRKTNNKEKPEWYFTQVSAWIRDHTHFLENRIQPLLDELALNHIDARLEFTRGLLQELDRKLRSDLPEIVYHDVLMSHLVDELLLFERELRTVLHYPPSSPSLLHVLLDEVPFHKWLSLEKTFAVDRLRSIMKLESAWFPAYRDMSAADDTLVPECTEGLMSLLAGITERYNSLPSRSHQLQFLDLQRDFLLEFHLDLSTNAVSRGSHDPLVPQYAAFLNASQYIATVLQEWAEQDFFLELHYFSKQHSQQEEEEEEEGATRSPLPPQQPSIAVVQKLRRQDPEFAALEGSVFDSVIEVFATLVRDMSSRMVQFITAAASTHCKKYRKEKWHSKVAHKDRVSLDITPSLTDLVTSLQQQLAFVSANVTTLVSQDIFENLFDAFDHLLFDEVVISNHFSDGGAQQLEYDVTTVILPLLTRHCNEITSKQLLERTQEACLLLQLLPGSARLLQDVLRGAVRGGGGRVTNDDYTAAVVALNEVKVHTLDPQTALQVLWLKIDGTSA